MSDTDYLDHSVFVTRDFTRVWARYEQLGFTLSPASRHEVTVVADGPLVPSCTANRCAYFGGSFVELIGVVDDTAPDPWRVLPVIDGGREGLCGASFGLGTSEQALHRLRAAGLAGSGILTLQRPVDTPEGSRTMRARSVHIDRAKTPEGILHTSEHLTPELVHQPRYRDHANGAHRLDEVLLVVADEELGAYRDRYRAILDRQPDGGVFRLHSGAMAVIPCSALPDVLPGERAPWLPFFAAHAVAVADLAAARAVVTGNGIATHDLSDGFFVRAGDAGGAAVIFRES